MQVWKSTLTLHVCEKTSPFYLTLTPSGHGGTGLALPDNNTLCSIRAHRLLRHDQVPAAGAGEGRAEPAEPAGGGAGKRRVREETEAAGGAAKSKPRSVCPHQRERSKCKECGEMSMCNAWPHPRHAWRDGGSPKATAGVRVRRNTCAVHTAGARGRRGRTDRPCMGCRHQRERSQCKDCGGASICHERKRSTCKLECGGRASASTSAEGTDARSAGGRASASTSAEGANVRRAGVTELSTNKQHFFFGCEHLRAQAHQEQMQGVSSANYRGGVGRCRGGGFRLGSHARAGSTEEAPKDRAHSGGIAGAQRRRRRQHFLHAPHSCDSRLARREG